jgi:hypothetical protein
MTGRRLFGKYDIIIFAALMIIAVLIYIIIRITGRGENGVLCEIRIDGKIVQRVSLSEPNYDNHDNYEFELVQNPQIRFKIKDNAIAFISSDCPDKICVNTGYINQTGQSAVCLPNRVSIHIADITDGKRK